MIDALEILSVLLIFTGLTVISCALLAAQADRLMTKRPFDSEFEEA